MNRIILILLVAALVLLSCIQHKYTEPPAIITAIRKHVEGEPIRCESGLAQSLKEVQCLR